MPQFNPAPPRMASARCEEFVIGPEMESDAANATRSRARRGTYENWFVNVADPARRQGYWIRYTSLNPAGQGAEHAAHSALWAFRFDHDDPSATWGAKENFPLAELKAQSRPSVLRLAPPWLPNAAAQAGRTVDAANRPRTRPRA